MNSQRLSLGRASRERSLFISVNLGFFLALVSTTLQSFGQDVSQAPNVARPAKVRGPVEWHIEIVPRISPEPRRLDVVPQNAAEDKLAPAPAEYREVYNSIPFSRSEYLANRDYRHEPTMELLMGQLRPKTVVKFEGPSSEIRFSTSFQTMGRGNGTPNYLPGWVGSASQPFWMW